MAYVIIRARHYKDGEKRDLVPDGKTNGPLTFERRRTAEAYLDSGLLERDLSSADEIAPRTYRVSSEAWLPEYITLQWAKAPNATERAA